MGALATKFGPEDAEWFEGLEDQLSKAVSAYDFSESPNWSDLDSLSAQTKFEGLSVRLDALAVQDGMITAPGTVFVTLKYGRGEDSFSFFDSYPVKFTFKIEAGEEGNLVVIKSVSVDTSSFYQ